MDHNLLLRWCSERASGSLAVFREAHEWLLGAPDPGSRGLDHDARHGQDRWTWSLYGLQALGHLEVDWVSRRWAVAPPVVTTLTDGGGFALLCGARPRALLTRLDNLARDRVQRLRDLSDQVVFDTPVAQRGGPDLRLLQAPALADARELCALLEIEFVDRAADRLLGALPPLNKLLLPGRMSDLPGGVAPAQMTPPVTGAGHRPAPTATELPGQVFADLDHDPGDPGSYEIRLYDVPRYFHRFSPGVVFEAERGVVVYAELRRTGRHVLGYDPASRVLLVPPKLRLPALYERAATLRSGLLPRLEPDAYPTTADGDPARGSAVLSYVNIDPPFAQRLAGLLHQQLHEVSRQPDAPAPRAGPRQTATARRPAATSTPERR